MGALIACSSGDNNADTTSGNGGGTSTMVGGAGGTGAQMPSSGPGGADGSQLIINEIMYDPKAVSDEAGEWIEIYNAGVNSVDLKGYRIHDQGSNSHTIASSVTVEAEGYVVLGRQGSNNGGYDADYVYGNDFFLANSKDAVILRGPDDAEIDSVIYGSTAPWPLKNAGVSIELSAPTLDNATPTSWQLAIVSYGDGDLGTPGGPNGGAIPGDYTIDDTVDGWHQPALKTSLFFGPFDPLESIVLDELKLAQDKIRLAFFNIRLYDVRQLLKSKIAIGVDVHVILDKKQQALSYNTMGEQLVADGITVTLVERTEAVDATMHDKFAIIDDGRVITGSANYSHTALNISDEDLVVMESSSLAARYQLEFDELIADGDDKSAPYGASDKIHAWMGPEDSIYQKVISALDGAQNTALVAMFQFNTSSILDAIIDAKNRGVAVVVVLDKVQADDPESLANETLSSAGISVVLAHNMGSNFAEMHSKFAVIDHQLLLIGSYNWTNLGSFFNDENLLIIDDGHLAARAEGKYADMLNAYGAPSASSLGLTTGPQTVDFEVNNVTLGAQEKLMIKSIGGGPFDPAVEMSGTTLAANVEAGTRIEYRYEIHDSKGPLALEGTTHAFTVPYAPGPFSVVDTFEK